MRVICLLVSFVPVAMVFYAIAHGDWIWVLAGFILDLFVWLMIIREDRSELR